MEESARETESEVGALEAPEVVETEVTETNEVESEPENESARDTVARVLREQELKAKGDGSTDEVSETKEEPKSEPKDEPQKLEKKEEADFSSSDFEPPSRLSPKEKQIFNKLPPEFKPAVARMFKEYQAHHTKAQMELSRAKEEASHVVQAVRPYYTSHPELAENGVTESQLVAALIGAHQKLTNKATDRQAIEKLATDRGYKIKFVGDDGEEVEGTREADVTSHPEFTRLQQSHNQLLSKVEKQLQDQVAQPIIREFDRVKDERDSSGTLRYPKLQEREFWVRARPVISALLETGLPPADALKKAYATLVGPPQGLNQVTPSAANNNRALKAASSVRGRSAPTSNGLDLSPDKIPDDPRATVRMVLQQQRAGRVA